MTEGQSLSFVDTNSAYVKGDNSVYQLVNLPSDNYSKLFANGDVVLDNPNSQQFDSNDSKNLLQDCVIDQIDNDSGFNSNVKIIIENEPRSSLQEITNHSASLQGLLEIEKLTEPSTVLHMDDLKNEIKDLNIENFLEVDPIIQNIDDINSIEEHGIIDEVVVVKDLSAPVIDNDVSIELPKDPKELLETLTPMLENNGGLRKNMQASFLKIMQACDPMPLQCLLINIIRSSQHSILKKLLMTGGFSELHAWLKEARCQINKPLMLELLQLFKLLPVNTKLLRTNSCAKDIKQLIKNNDERISRFARVIVDDWMKIVSGSTAKQKEVPKSVQSKVDKKPDIKSHLSPPKVSKQNSKTKVEKIDSGKVEKGSFPQNSPSLSNSEDKIVKIERPKTVKRRQYTFRMTGLEEDATFKSTKRSTNITTAVTTSTTTASALSGGPPSPKKNEDDATKSNFFDALQFNSSFLQHRKRKAAVAPTTKPVAATTKPVAATSSNTTTQATTISTSPVIVSAPSPVISKNVSNVLPGFSYYKPLEDMEPIKTETPKATTASATSTTLSVTSTTFTTDPPFSYTFNDYEAPVAKKSKSKKCLSWAAEKNLCDFRFFEVDPTERCNVNTTNYFQHDDNETFVNHRKQESEMERQLLQEWHKTKQPLISNQPTGTIDWRTPEVLDIEAPNDVVPGSESVERSIQLQREAVVLQFIYFDNVTIPDFPGEPDPPSATTSPEFIPCKVIPLLPEEEEEEADDTMDSSDQSTNQIPPSSIAMPISHSYAPITTQNDIFDVSCGMNGDDDVLSGTINTTPAIIDNNSHHFIGSDVVCEPPPLNNINKDFPQHSFLNNNNFVSAANNENNHFYTGDAVNSNGNFAGNPNYNSNTYQNSNYPNTNANNPAYFSPHNNNNAAYEVNNGVYNGSDLTYSNNNNQYNVDYNYNNDQSNNNNSFPKPPFQPTASMPVYPIGFNQATFNPTNQRPPFDPVRGFPTHPRDFHNQFRHHNGNFPPKKFNRNKNIDKNEVCRFFIQGKCMFGINCKKIHPPTN